MKIAKIFVALISVCVSLVNTSAQQIPNGDFEEWIYYPETILEVPKNWTTNDLLYKKFDPAYKGVTVKKTTHSHSGRYALQMEVAISNGDTVNGGIYSIGSIDSLMKVIYKTSAAGFKCSAKYETFTGYYIFDCKGGDTAIFGVDLTVWNKAKHKRDTLVNTTLRIGQKAPDYLPFVVPLKYKIENEDPDTALIVIGIQGSGSKPAHEGTTLIIDDLKFSGMYKGKK